MLSERDDFVDEGGPSPVVGNIGTLHADLVTGAQASLNRMNFYDKMVASVGNVVIFEFVWALYPCLRDETLIPTMRSNNPSSFPTSPARPRSSQTT